MQTKLNFRSILCFFAIAILTTQYGNADVRSDTHIAKWLPDGPSFCVHTVRYRAERVQGEASQITAAELDGLINSLRMGFAARCRRMPSRLIIVHKDKTGKEVETTLESNYNFRILDRSLFASTPPEDELQRANPSIFVRLKTPQERAVAYDAFIAKARTLSGVQTEPLEVPNWNREYLTKERQKYERAIASGTIYKANSYWQPYGDSFVQKTFEGREYGVMSAIHLDSPLMRAAVLSYVRVKSNSCPDSFDQTDGVFERTETTTTFNGYGNIIDKTTKHMGYVQVDRRFVPLYAYYTDAENSPAIGKSILAEIEALANNQLGQVLDYGLRVSEYYLKANSDHVRLFSTEGCNSPVTAQYEENLYRYAMSLPNVQTASIPIPSAREYSDTPPTGNEPIQSVSDICLARTQQSAENLAYCTCVHNSMSENFGARAFDVYKDARRIRDIARSLGENSSLTPLLLSLNVATSKCSS